MEFRESIGWSSSVELILHFCSEASDKFGSHSGMGAFSEFAEQVARLQVVGSSKNTSDHGM